MRQTFNTAIEQAIERSGRNGEALSQPLVAHVSLEISELEGVILQPRSGAGSVCRLCEELPKRLPKRVG